MGAVEKAVDSAANFIGPFVDAGAKKTAGRSGEESCDNVRLVREAIEHLQAINTADQAADPDAPYDASLAGVVYGLLDLITSLGILPYLSSGVAFSQRPRSVLIATFTLSSSEHKDLLPETVRPLLSILEQKEGTGLQPLLAQRSLPDIISALAELTFSPQHTQQADTSFSTAYNGLIARVSTSRLLPILTTFLQQPLPSWLKPQMGKEIATVPLRAHGIRHVIEFLSLSYLSQNSRVPQDALGPQSRIPIPLEAIRQATKLLISPPGGTTSDSWIQKLEPQLWNLLDGSEGRELSRAAGHIIAGGFLSKRNTGAPGTTGWNLFAQPILETICPRENAMGALRTSTKDHVLVQDQDLLVALHRLDVVTASYSYAPLTKRLVGPILLPLWALLQYAQSKPSLDKIWAKLPHSIITRFIAVACDPKSIDNIATNLFWDGLPSWTFGPGGKGGIEIRVRGDGGSGSFEGMESILFRISSLAGRIDLFVSLLADAKVSDAVIGLIFLQVTKRWLVLNRRTNPTLLLESDDDPLTALTDAKLSEALASRFKGSLARSPQHIVELMGQLLQSYVSDHRAGSERQTTSLKPRRADLESIVTPKSTAGAGAKVEDSPEDDLVAFAISILNALVAAPEFKSTPSTDASFSEITRSLHYLSHAKDLDSVTPGIVSSAHNLLQTLSSSAIVSSLSKTEDDPLASQRSALQVALQDLTSPEAPIRRWSLSTLHKLMVDPSTFSIIDVPRTAYLILSASLADSEPYVHSAAISVLVTLALNAPHPTSKILLDAFLDVDERSLELSKGRMTEEKERELQESLDYRLRIGEVLNDIVLADDFWDSKSSVGVKYTSIKHMVSACLTLASRRGQRHKTQASRQAVSLQIVQQQEEAEAAWGGPIPNIFEPDGAASVADQADFEALNKIVTGWEATRHEEDVRIRASAMSILGTVLEKRLRFVGQAAADAGLQTVVLILTMETGSSFFILRRAAVLVVMGLLKALDAALDASENSGVDLGMKQQDEVDRVLKWVRDEDGDELVRDHAANVIEGLETLRMKKLYKIRDEGMKMRPNLGLDGGLRGLSITPAVDGGQGKRRMVVEEMD